MLSVTVRHPQGLHMRVAATAVDILSRTIGEPQVDKVYLHARQRSVPLTDLMAIVSLQVKNGERVSLSMEDGNVQSLLPVARFLGKPDPVYQASAVDKSIQQWALQSQVILNNMLIGLVIVDRSNRITFLNRSALRQLGLKNDAGVIGQNSDKVLPQICLTQMLRPDASPVNKKHQMGARTVLMTTTPILVNKELHGAMAMFRDVSDFVALAEELKAVKALKGQYDLVLQSVQDAICVTDEHGIVRFINPAYEKLHGIRADEVLNKSVHDISPTGIRARVHRTGTPAFGRVCGNTSPDDIVADVRPILVDGEMKGALSVSRRVSDVQLLIDQIEKLREETRSLKAELGRQQSLDEAFSTIIGSSTALLATLSVANKAAATNSTVLIMGESGTGKELAAKAIHDAGPRRNTPFVCVNCAGIPTQLMESELFGHERGAFTGAVATRKGKFELAHGGTIFLDEIGELPIEVQAKLLRVLQEYEVERVGGDRVIPLDVRVIAATNRDLRTEVEQKRFREDLFYRIHVVQITMPPLRERSGDIPRLVQHFLEDLSKVVGKRVRGFTHEALTLLENHHWPGNVRQLKNVIEYALNVCDGDWIEIDHLGSDITHEAVSRGNRVNLTDGWRRAPVSVSMFMPSDAYAILDDAGPLLKMEEYERRIITRALSVHGSFNAAAKALGLTHKTVAAKARKFGLVK